MRFKFCKIILSAALCSSGFVFALPLYGAFNLITVLYNETVPARAQEYIECMERNERVAQILEADDNVAAYRGTCIPIPKGEYDARARNNS